MNIYFNNNHVEIHFKELKNQLNKLYKTRDCYQFFLKYSEHSKIINDPAIGSLIINFIIGCMTTDEFQSFLSNEQKLNLDTEQLKDAINKIINQNEEQTYLLLSENQFSDYLFSFTNLIEDPKRTQIYQDMDMPLNNYYIKCSRQTMQLNIPINQLECMDQYKNKDQAELPILYAFEQGARYIEINVWDGPDGNPVCYYGPMMNFSISLNFVFNTIKEYAFKYSHFPLFVNLNDHCSRQQKPKIIQIIKGILGDQLGYFDRSKSYLDSPNELKFKILLIKTITPKILQSTMIFNDISFELEIYDEEEEKYSFEKNSNVKSFQSHSLCIQNGKFRNSIQSSNNSDIQQTISPQMILNPSKKGQSQLFEGQDQNYYLYELYQENFKLIDQPDIVYLINDSIELRGIRSLKDVKSIKQQQSTSIPSMPKFEETDLKDNNEIKNNIQTTFKYSRQGKIYKYMPNCKETDNENTYCSQGFLIGASLILMHPHLIDYNLMYYDAKFKENGGINSGYLLKPFAQQGEQKKIYQNHNYTLKLEIVSGYQIYSRKYSHGCSPLLQVLLRYPKLGEEDFQEQMICKPLQDSCFNPIFNLSCEFNFKNLDFAVVLFCLYHQNVEQLISWNSFPVSMLLQGYKIIQLKDEYNNFIDNSLLLCKVELI